MITPSQSKIIQMFSDLTFDEERHLYYWKGRQIPYSVTGLVKQHIIPFDADNMSHWSALKQSKLTGVPVTAHELKKKWQNISIGACELGTKVHKFMEDFTGLETPTCGQEVAGIKYIKSLEGQYRISFRELRAYSREFDYAGTMDLPLLVLGNETEEYCIDDYKTNGDLFKSYDMMKPPFDYLDSSAYNQYQLQLSYYQIMLEEYNIKITNRRLVHLKADGEFVIYPLWDFTNELRDYIKLNKRQAA